MKNRDAVLHLRGESLFTDDLSLTHHPLVAYPFCSTVAHAAITGLDLTQARQVPGVAAVLCARDIPGDNQIGNVIEDEPLFADQEVHYLGQPMALVIAGDIGTARKAAGLIKPTLVEKPAVFDPREAAARGQFISPPRTFNLGDPQGAWKSCDFVVSGRLDSGGQEHLYLEPQVAYALPTEQGGVKIVSSTQAPTAVQRTAARVLGLPMHRVEVDVPRLGGAFGGKEDQATAWAVMAGLGALCLRRPVKLLLSRQEDLRLTGKRHPYSSDFRIGLMRDGRIVAYEVDFYQNAGASADLSTAILERTLFHATNSYFVPHVRARGYSCRTNLPPFTAFRGFGGPQAMAVMEAAIVQAAGETGLSARFIQARNLLRRGDTLPFGMAVRSGNARASWKRLHKNGEVSAVYAEIARFNRQNHLFKRGAALMPVCFGISFTSTFLNQASALVHVYQDGSVGLSTAAVEMGQGVNSKLTRIAADTLGIDPRRIKVETTNTSRNANTSPTAASTGADLNGNALLLACQDIRVRLMRFAAEALNLSPGDRLTLENETLRCNDQTCDLTWPELVHRAYFARVSLSAQAHYATPGLFFDRQTNRGDAFAYHVHGAALVTARLDCLRGSFEFDRVRIVHDAGRSLDPLIDRGQVEGALVQGLGWVALEDLIYDGRGRLLTDSLSTYKVPDIFFAPRDVETEFLSRPGKSPAPFHSKAIGEPPFMYGIGGYFAVLAAMKAFRPDLTLPFCLPITPERVLEALYP
jgi:xanthine dehydrogenase large subunit